MPDPIDDLLDQAVGVAAAEFLQSCSAPEPGQAVSHYEIVERIGAGGMGIVCKAIDRKLDRIVALKFLLASGDDERQQAQLEQEARAASALNHPSICTVHDFDDDGRYRFIVMEYLEGETLKARLSEGPLAAEDALDITLSVASALAAAHARGLVHCDIKPANVFLTARGGVKVLDFGIARLQRDAAAATLSGSDHRDPGAGTTAYMSPEQAHGEEIDGRSDIFSLGAMLREMVRDPQPALARIIERMHGADREARYQTIAEVIAALERMRARRAAVRRLQRYAAAAAATGAILGALWWQSSKPAPLTARDFVLIADVENRTGDPAFDAVLSEAVAVHLDQSPFLTVFSNVRVREQLELMRRAGDERLTPDVARELALRAGIKAFIAGSLTRVGSQYLLRLEAVNAQTGDYISREQQQVADGSAVLRAVGEAASAIRQDLGESYASIQRFDMPIESATTSSLEAFRAFQQGQAVLLQGTGAALKAIPFFKRAVELDPQFALAHARLGVAYENVREFTRAEDAAREAFRHRARVSERERYQILARYYQEVSGEISKAVEALDMWAQSYPGDARPHNSLMAIFKDVGRLEEAAQHGEAAVRLSPASASYRANLAGAYLRLSDFARAWQVCEEAVHDGLDNSTIHRFRHIIALIRDDRAAIAHEETWRAARTSDYATAEFAGSMAAADGRMQEARRLYADAIARAERQSLTDRAAEYRVRLALAGAYAGERDEPGRLAREVLAARPTRLVAADAVFVLARVGAADGGALIDSLAKRFHDDELLRDVWQPLIASVTAIANGRPGDAVDGLRHMDSYDRGDHAMLRAAYHRGEALLAIGRGRDARTAFQRVIDNRGVVVTRSLYALAHLGLARAARLERDAAAPGLYEKFFELWKDADANVPVLRQARQEYALLIGRPKAS